MIELKRHMYLRKHLIVLALLIATAMLACGTDYTVSTTSEGTMKTTTGKSTATASTYDNRATGVVAVHLEQIQGYFIEGFEIGLRFETAEGDVIASTLWSDFIRSQGNPQLKTYYNSVLEQPVPVGHIVVLATVNVGVGPPPEIPDLDGDLRCCLKVHVPDNGRVDVEVSFGDRDDCLRLL